MASNALIQSILDGAGVALRSGAIVRTTRNAPGFPAVWSQASQIPGWFEEINAAAFWAVIAEKRPETVVEIGSYLGRSSALIGLSLQKFCHNPRLVSIDPHTGDRQQKEILGVDELPTAQLFALHMAGMGLKEMVDMRISTSRDVALTWNDPIDLIFVDGWHSYDAVLEDGCSWSPYLSSDGLVCFDDYGTYPEVKEAVIKTCKDMQLQFYGTVTTQAWAGRRPTPPPGLQTAIRWTRPLRSSGPSGGS
jgi:predicted O-methyltransferase YrrM